MINKHVFKQMHRDYISSETWANKKRILSVVYNQNSWPIDCVRCRTNCNLNCHHNYYIDAKYKGHENISDIDYLCTKCHDEWHVIQRNSGLSQNNLFEQYYNYITGERTCYGNTAFLNLLSKKIKIDDAQISEYFSQECVIKYVRRGNLIAWLFTLSFPLVFVYGIGIITMMITIVMVSGDKEPENYSLYKHRKIPIDIKKKLITNLSKCN